MLDHLELAGYENSLKTYRDFKGVIETARKEGREGGKLEGIIKVATAMKQNGIPTSVIALTTGLTENEIEEL
jgi:predicted transposase/invertase (TIGR01784 family)